MSNNPKYDYFVGKDKYETDQASLTGAMIKAKIPNYPAGYILVLEGDGGQKDTVIADDQSVEIAPGHGHGVRHFVLQPPTNFGASRG
jgi:hypothetical protein